MVILNGSQVPSRTLFPDLCLYSDPMPPFAWELRGAEVTYLKKLRISVPFFLDSTHMH